MHRSAAQPSEPVDHQVGQGERETNDARKLTPAKGVVRARRSGPAADLPVRDDEERWTEEELIAVRRQLEAEINALEEEVAAAEAEMRDRLGDAVRDAGDDQADAGAKTFEREHELALTYNARDMISQNERAIARIDAGTYGVCETCGQPIGKARLQAFPRATLCVRCKQRQERR